MIDKETLVTKIFPMKCKHCSSTGFLSWLVWSNLLFDEKKDELICWSCAHMHGLIKIEEPREVLLNPEYQRAR